MLTCLKVSFWPESSPALRQTIGRGFSEASAGRSRRGVIEDKLEVFAALGVRKGSSQRPKRPPPRAPGESRASNLSSRAAPPWHKDEPPRILFRSSAEGQGLFSPARIYLRSRSASRRDPLYPLSTNSEFLPSTFLAFSRVPIPNGESFRGRESRANHFPS